MAEGSQKSSHDPIVDDKFLYLCFQLIKEKNFLEAEKKISAGLKKAEEKNDAPAQGLYLSAMGFLFKVQGDFKKSYKFYQQAEKFIPDDDSLKIITANFLIYQFRQFDTASRKLEKLLKNKINDAAIWHHAQALLGIAYLNMGKRNECQKVLENLLKSDFALLGSATNVNFQIPEVLEQKGFARESCLAYLKKAKTLAIEKRELVYQQAIEKLIEGVQDRAING